MNDCGGWGRDYSSRVSLSRISRQVPTTERSGTVYDAMRTGDGYVEQDASWCRIEKLLYLLYLSLESATIALTPHRLKRRCHRARRRQLTARSQAPHAMPGARCAALAHVPTSGPERDFKARSCLRLRTSGPSGSANPLTSQRTPATRRRRARRCAKAAAVPTWAAAATHLAGRRRPSRAPRGRRWVK